MSTNLSDILGTTYIGPTGPTIYPSTGIAVSTGTEDGKYTIFSGVLVHKYKIKLREIYYGSNI